MGGESKSCTVALYRPCNYATFTKNDATRHATDMQPKSLKALAIAVLQRNQACNQDATIAKKLCNFLPKKSAQKLHSSCSYKLKSEQEKLFCYCCKGSEFWLSIHGKLTCRVCHPPAHESLEVKQC